MDSLTSHNDLLEKITVLQKDLASKTKEIDLLKEKSHVAELEIYKQIVNSVSEAIYILNEKWEFVEVNRGAEKMYGYTREELIGKTPRDVSAPNKNNISEVIKHNEFVLKNGGTRSFEFWGIRKNKEVFFKEVIVNQGIFRDKKVVIATARDVTDRKEAEFEALKFKSISDKALNGNAIVDLKGRILYINDYFAKILGYTKDELIGENLSIFHSEIQLPRVLQLNKVLFETGSYNSEEVGHVHKDGSEFPMLMNGVVIYDDKNVPLYLAATAIDITEIKLAQSKLKESEEKFRAIFENAPMLIDAFDENGKCVLWNRECEKTFGWTINEINNIEDSTKLFYPNPEVQKDVKKAIATKPDGEFREWKPVTKHGKSINTLWANFKISTGLVINLGYDITERKKAEKELADRNEQFDLAIAATSDGLYDWDLKTNEVYFSPNWKKMLGYEDHELENSVNTMNSLVGPEYGGKSYKLRKDIIQGEKEILDVEFQMRHKDGHWVDILSRGKAIFNKEGKAIRWIGTHQDISERKNMENALIENEEKFRALYDNAPMAYQSLDIDGRFLDVNPTWISILGFEREEVIGSKYADFLHPNWQPHFEQNFPKFKARGYIKDVQFKLRHKKGHYIDVSFEGCIGYHPNGNFKQTYCVFKDITTQKLAQKSLSESEAKFKGVYQNANIGMALGDKYANILDANNEFLTLLEYSIDEIVGMNFSEFTHPDDITKEYVFIEKFLANELDNYRLEKRYITKSKKTVWVDLAVTARRNMNGEIDMFIGMVMDINKSKKIETELIRAKNKAEESDHLKSAFLANMSHEIRTPMNGILGFAELLEQANLSEAEQKQYVEIIKKSGARMLSTVNDIIDISKIDAKQVVVDRSLVNLTEEINSLYLFFKPEAQQKGLELNLKSEFSTTGLLLQTDQGKFISILTNLIKNAIKYTDDGEIEIGMNIKDEILLFWVKDTGIGIPENRKQAIFNRFEQADIDDSYAREGSGLGLAIARSYAEILDGQIYFKSEQGVGSTFYFKLPCSINIKSINETDAEAIENEIMSKQFNLLIAEDDDISFQHLEIVLKNMAKSIIRAKNGIEAVEMAKSNKNIDCILLDIKMPMMDGYAACRKIRASNKDVVIIAQTAYALQGEREKAINAGCNDYLPKPLKPQELIEMMENYIP